MTKAETIEFQKRLKAAGFDPGPIDGIQGWKTDDAAIAYAMASLTRPEEDEETRLIREQLQEDEGWRPYAYLDSRGYLTIGHGRLIDKAKGGRITPEEGRYLLDHDIDDARRFLDEKLPWWRSLDTVRRQAMVNMAFQMGGRLLTFTATLPLIQAGEYKKAAANMRKSDWYKQTPARAERAIKMIEEGTDA